MACPFARVASALGIQSGSEEAKAAFASSPYHSHSAHAAGGSAPASSSLASLKALSAFVAASSIGKNAAAHDDRAQSSSSTTLLSPLSAPLSQHLSTGTASAHRQVERSAGVKALMASLSKGGNKELAMGRLDYVRWLIMIDAVYLVMESELLALQRTDSSIPSTSTTPTMLRPFLSHPTLLPTLLRTSTIEADINAHVAALEEETSISLADHVEAAAFENDDPSSSSSSATANQEKLELKKLVARYRNAGDSNSRIDLLTRRQVSTTLAYVNRIRHLASPSLPSSSISSATPPRTANTSAAGPAALFSHAYTRYMGDLSGGQFIKKHIEAKWPCLDSSQGFAFYDFDASPFESRESSLAEGSLAAKMAGEKALKDAFRSSMDEGFEHAAAAAAAAAEGGDRLRQTLAEEMVAEGVIAFELNGDLFDALIDSSVQTFAAPLRKEDGLLQEQVQSRGKSLHGLMTLLPILLILLASVVVVWLDDSSPTAAPANSQLLPSLHQFNSTVKAGLGKVGSSAAVVEAVAHIAHADKMGI